MNQPANAVLPSRTDRGLFPMILVSVSCVLISLFFSGLLHSYTSDQDLLIPIIRAGAEPGIYPPSDLIVSAGTQGPYHFYHLASKFWLIAGRFDLIWFGSYILFLLGSYIAYWRLARVVSGRVIVANLTILAISLMPPFRGSLNWSWVPLPTMVSSHAAMPFAISGLSLLIERRYAPSIVMAGVAFIVHPGLGAILISAIGFCLLFEREMTIQRRLAYFLMLAVSVLPNALFLMLRLSDNWIPVDKTGSSLSLFRTIFESFSYHSFIDPHWREGYGWFFLLGAAAVWGSQNAPVSNRRQIGLVVAICLLLLGLYVINIYTLLHPGVALSFLFRTTMYLKPLFISLFFCGLAGFLTRHPRPDSWVFSEAVPILALLGGAFFFPSVPFAEAFFTLALGCILLRRVPGRSAGLGIAVFGWGVTQALIFLVVAFSSQHRTGSVFTNDWLIAVNVFVGTATGMVLLLEKTRVQEPYPHPDDRFDKPRYALLTVVFATCLGLAQQLAIHRSADRYISKTIGAFREALEISAPPKGMSGIYTWFRDNSRNPCLVMVPPFDPRFSRFRTATARGVYSTVYDINQLAYDQKFYTTGYSRLMHIGVRVISPHTYDVSGYHNLTSDALNLLHNKDHVDYAIFDTALMNDGLRAIPSAFEADGCRVLDLSQL